MNDVADRYVHRHETARWMASTFYTYVERSTLLGVLYAIAPVKFGSVSFYAHWQAWVFMMGAFLLGWPFATWVYWQFFRRYPADKGPLRQVSFLLIGAVVCGAVASTSIMLATAVGELLSKLVD